MNEVNKLMEQVILLRKDKSLPYLEADLLYALILQQQYIIKLLEAKNEGI